MTEIMKPKIITAITLLAASAFACTPVFAKGGSRSSYSGGSHSSSHGGHYSGGSGKSHKGGTYVSPRGGNDYGKHKK